MRQLLFATCFALVLAYHSPAQINEQDWEAADLQIVRLPPTDFPDLPPTIVQALQARGCTIPQTYRFSEPHNVIQGEFAIPGQKDWAVVCSVNRVSSILIFWGGSDQEVHELDKVPDRSWLRDTGNGKLGFSRYIFATGKEAVEIAPWSYRDQKPPVIDHDGLEVAFFGEGRAHSLLPRRRLAWRNRVPLPYLVNTATYAN